MRYGSIEIGLQGMRSIALQQRPSCGIPTCLSLSIKMKKRAIIIAKVVNFCQFSSFSCTASTFSLWRSAAFAVIILTIKGRMRLM
jgi:hypothetical protein